MLLTDFPKIQCPFIRKTFAIDKGDWQKHGSSLNLKNAEAYLAVNQVNPGYEWVFEDEDTVAIEKLDGTNIKILTEKGRLIHVQNRKNIIDPLQVMKGKTNIIEGIFRSIGKGYVQMDGEQVGELIGPKVQGNPYKLDFHEWIPFTRAIETLGYRSFNEHERTFDNLSSWFKDHLFSRLFTKRATKLKLDDKVMAEGVVFYNLRRKSDHKTWMAKLRRDMFDWYYSDQIKIHAYSAN